MVEVCGEVYRLRRLTTSIDLGSGSVARSRRGRGTRLYDSVFGMAGGNESQGSIARLIRVSMYAVVHGGAKSRSLVWQTYLGVDRDIRTSL